MESSYSSPYGSRFLLLNAGELPIVPKALKKSANVSSGGPAGFRAEKFLGGGATGKKFGIDMPDARFVNGAAKFGSFCPEKSPNGASPISLKSLAPSNVL